MMVLRINYTEYSIHCRYCMIATYFTVYSPGAIQVSRDLPDQCCSYTSNSKQCLPPGHQHFANCLKFLFVLQALRTLWGIGHIDITWLILTHA